MAEFSLDLNEDQIQLQQWVHDFAKNVVRPVAPKYDELEETPWDVIQEAANIGLYSWEFVAQCFADPTGLTFPVISEELSWGDAGIGLAIFGTTLGVSGIVGNGTPEQIAEWVPQCFGTPDNIQLAAFAVSEPDAGSDVSSLRTRAVYDEKTDEWVINGTKTWITNGGIDKVPTVHVVVAAVEPELKSRGHASFVVPPGTPGLSMGQKFSKMGIRASHTAEVVFDDVRVPGNCLLGGKEKLDARLARAREGKYSKTQAAMATFEASRPLVSAQALGIGFPAQDVLVRATDDTLDVAAANKLLDGLGLTQKDSEGFRLRPDNGKRITIELLAVKAFMDWPKHAEMISQHWRKIGIFGDVKEAERGLAGFDVREFSVVLHGKKRGRRR